MFGLFKRSPRKKLQAEYERTLERARDLQRQGDIEGFAAVTAEADQIARQIEALDRAED